MENGHRFSKKGPRPDGWPSNLEWPFMVGKLNKVKFASLVRWWFDSGRGCMHDPLPGDLSALPQGVGLRRSTRKAHVTAPATAIDTVVAVEKLVSFTDGTHFVARQCVIKDIWLAAGNQLASTGCVGGVPGPYTVENKSTMYAWVVEKGVVSPQKDGILPWVFPSLLEAELFMRALAVEFQEKNRRPSNLFLDGLIIRPYFHPHVGLPKDHIDEGDCSVVLVLRGNHMSCGIDLIVDSTLQLLCAGDAVCIGKNVVHGLRNVKRVGHFQPRLTLVAFYKLVR